MFRHALSRVVAQKGACHLVQGGGSVGGSAIGRVVAVAAVCHDRPVHSLAHVLTQAASGHDDNHTHAAPGPRFNYFTSFVAPGSGTASDKASHGIVRFVTADAGSKDGVCQVAGIEVPPKQVRQAGESLHVAVCQMLTQSHDVWYVVCLICYRCSCCPMQTAQTVW